jgi:4-alpha-glucanotransferase
MPQSLTLDDFLTSKRAGVLIPLFSVYSEKSFGIGDFDDLKPAVDWLKFTGNSILQLLPMNEMGGTLCPYDSVSSFALEPAYISLAGLPLPKDKSFKRQIESLRRALPHPGSHVDYAVRGEKLRIMREIFASGESAASLQFAAFQSDNSYWLEDFSLYKVIKEICHGAPWYEWPLELRNRDGGAIEEILKRHSQEIDFQKWVQWQLFEQFKEAKAYACAKKIFLKGDLPILVSRDSADVWAHAGFFKLEFAAGAPPDMYCAKGQRWGMPTYNWENIKADGYRYLKEKLKYAQNFYDILRIDHVVGLFRIWSIPYNDAQENQGLNGRFDPSDECLWRQHGSQILKVMQDSTDMRLCAEDLGVIPQSCTETLRDLNIPGNDVQRWVKDWSLKHDFLDPEDYRRLSVTMLSTHDTTNWPAWWENEAGTVDEALFIRKCSDQRNIGFEQVKGLLFDPSRSRHGRLRWRDDVDSAQKLVEILGLPGEHLNDFLDLWENSFREKEKLWKKLKLKGPMREKSDPEIVEAALKGNLCSAALISINTIFDLFYLGDILKGDPYGCRINTPGTVSSKNWSLIIPFSIDELKKNPVSVKIKEMVLASGRSAK